jgi:hypothetical protein
MKDKAAYRRGVEASTSPPKERYAQTDINVFQLFQPAPFADPLTEALRNDARALLGAGRRGRSDDLETKYVGKEECTDEVVENSTDFRCWHIATFAASAQKWSLSERSGHVRSFIEYAARLICFCANPRRGRTCTAIPRTSEGGSNPFFEPRMHCFACARNEKSFVALRQSNPTGKSPKVCPASRVKIFLLIRRANQMSNSACLTATRGAIAIVTIVRWDAVDARSRLTSAASAYGEVVWA